MEYNTGKMITSLANAKVKYVQRLQADKRFRTREKAFVIEGTRWLAELIHLAQPAKLVFYTEEWRNTANHHEILGQLDAPTLPVSDPLMAAMSDTQTPPGVLAVVPILPRPLPVQPSLLLILDAVTNPGNLGTMLRTAGAAGVDGLLLAPGCVDAYNPKVVRGSMGAHLRLPIHELTWPEITNLVAGLQVWLAAADGDRRYSDVNWRVPSALIIGSEASGESAEGRQVAHGRIAIPMHTATESLNAAVAAGIILFEAARQRGE
jgi:TrmH family RNA methyltransferase